MAIILDRINGLSDSRWSGIANSVAECVGLDLNSCPGLTKVHQRLAKESGTTVDEFVKVAMATSTGESFWFSADSGKIWRRSSTGTWLLVFTTTAAAGEVKCLGAEEYNGHLYWATQSRLHRISMADAHATAANWTANAVLNWATFAVTDVNWHPMAIQDLSLFIGDGNRVAEVNESGTFDNNVLDIKTPLRIKTMIPYEIDLLIGTYVADTINRTEIIRWDTVSPSWNTSDPIEEVGINAFIRDDNYVYVNAGKMGNLYFYNGEELVLFKRIPGTYSKTQYGTIHPNSVANFKGIPIFGFSNGSGDPANQGVYSLGSYSRDYPKVLDLSFPISERSGGALVLTGIEIGAILVADFDILVAWKNGTSYGVDALDYSNKLELAYFSTRMLFQEGKNNLRDVLKTLGEVVIYYESLPTGTGFTISYKINYGSWVAMTNFNDTLINAIKAELSVENIGTLQVKVAFNVSENLSPTLDALGVSLR